MHARICDRLLLFKMASDPILDYCFVNNLMDYNVIHENNIINLVW